MALDAETVDPALQLSFRSPGKNLGHRVSFNRGGRGEVKRPALLLAAVGGAETERAATAAAVPSRSSGALGAPRPRHDRALPGKFLLAAAARALVSPRGQRAPSRTRGSEPVLSGPRFRSVPAVLSAGTW